MGFRSGLPQPHSSKCLIPLWLAALKRPSRFGRGRVLRYALGKVCLEYVTVFANRST